MAQATNTTLGEVVLGGDLGGDANLPELRASGVTPGTYAPVQRLSVDAKGRVTSVGQTTSAELAAAVQDASTSVKGVVQSSAAFNISGGVISVTPPNASTSTKGFVQPSTSGFTVTSGTVSANEGTTSSKGVIQVGSGFSVSSGVLSATIADATTSTKGLVQVGNNLSVSSGVLSISDATTSSKGVLQVGSNISVSAGSISIANATTSVKGVVQAGSGMSVDGGTLSIQDAAVGAKGIAQIGSGLSVTSGVVSIDDASDTVKGIVQVGSGLSVTGGVVSIPDATTGTKGVIQASTGIDVTSGVMSLANATTSTKGGVQVGTGIDVSGGVLSIGDATTGVKGLVQIGSNLSVSGGVVSVTSANDATTSTKGVVQVDSAAVADGHLTITSGTLDKGAALASTSAFGFAKVGSNLSISSGVLSVVMPDATTSTKGVVQVGSGLSVTGGVLSYPDATTTSKGIVQPGVGMYSNLGTLGVQVPDATTTSKGYVQIDELGSIVDDGAGLISIPDAFYSQKGIVAPAGITGLNGLALVPDEIDVSIRFLQATDSSFGTIKVGTGLAATAGVISTTAPATSSTIGLVKPDNVIIGLESDVLSMDASKTKKGIVSVSAGTSAVDIVAGEMSAKPATTSYHGAVKPSTTNFTVAGDGAMTISSSNPLLSTTSNSVVNTRYSLSTITASPNPSGVVSTIANCIFLNAGNTYSTFDLNVSNIPIGGMDVLLSAFAGHTVTQISVQGNPVHWENGSMPTFTGAGSWHIRIVPSITGGYFLAYQVN